jgi:hypothetical protein
MKAYPCNKKKMWNADPSAIPERQSDAWFLCVMARVGCNFQNIFECIQAAGETLQSEVLKLIHYIWSKEGMLIGERSLLVY